MPIKTDSLNKNLYKFLKVRGYDPLPKDSSGETVPVPDEAEVFKFTYKKNGQAIDSAWVTIDGNQQLKLYYDDDLMNSDADRETTDPNGMDDSWTGFMQQLKMWGQRRQLGFETENKDHLSSDMAQRAHIKKQEQVQESTNMKKQTKVSEQAKWRQGYRASGHPSGFKHKSGEIGPLGGTWDEVMHYDEPKKVPVQRHRDEIDPLSMRDMAGTSASGKPLLPKNKQRNLKNMIKGAKHLGPVGHLPEGVAEGIEDTRKEVNLKKKIDKGTATPEQKKEYEALKARNMGKKQGVAEGSYEETEETAVINMFEKLVKQGRDPIDMIAHKFGWGSYELDQLAKNLGFKNSAEWARGVMQGKGVNAGLAEGTKQQDMTGQTCAKCKKGKYKERSFNDDRDGTVRCSCGHVVDRWKKYKEQGLAEGSENVDAAGKPVDQELVKRQGKYWDQVAKERKQKEKKDKKKVDEGYYPMGKSASYSDAVPTVKIVLQHTRQIQEGEQRYRNIARIFLENQQGERILCPSTRPGIAQVYARHLAEGGLPHDDRWNHINSLCEEYTKMAGFARAAKYGVFNESAQKLVNEGINHYNKLRESLSKMRGHRGYQAYFESYTPALMETDGDTSNLNELFVQSTLDPRIESVMPILSRLHKNISEMAEVDQLAEWADSITEEGDGGQTALNPIGIPESEGTMTKAQYLQKRKALQQIQMAPGKTDNATKAAIAKKLAELRKQAIAAGVEIANVEECGIMEGKMAEVDMLMQDLASGEKDIYQVMYHPTTPEEIYASDILEKMYDEVSQDQGLHPDDDFEEIIEIMAEYLADEYGDAPAGANPIGMDASEKQLHELDTSTLEKYREKNVKVRGDDPKIKQRTKGLKAVNKKLATRYGPNSPDDSDDSDSPTIHEDLGPEQERVGQLGPTEKVGKKGAVGKLVGANENFINSTQQAVVTEEGQEDLDAILRIVRK